MALTTSEISRIKSELGYNVLTLGAVPYISVYAIFDAVIQPYLQEGGDTTSTTTVTVATSYTPVTLTLASSTGFAAGYRVWIDVDDRQEEATIQSLTGSTITVLLKKAHTGTYPVTVDGGLAIIRQLLRRIREGNDRLAKFSGYGAGALKKVDEIEFYPGASVQSAIKLAREGVDYFRDQLASTLGLHNFNKPQGGAGCRIAL